MFECQFREQQTLQKDFYDYYYEFTFFFNV